MGNMNCSVWKVIMPIAVIPIVSRVYFIHITWTRKSIHGGKALFLLQSVLGGALLRPWATADSPYIHSPNKECKVNHRHGARGRTLIAANWCKRK